MVGACRIVLSGVQRGGVGLYIVIHKACILKFNYITMFDHVELFKKKLCVCTKVLLVMTRSIFFFNINNGSVCAGYVFPQPGVQYKMWGRTRALYDNCSTYIGMRSSV